MGVAVSIAGAGVLAVGLLAAATSPVVAAEESLLERDVLPILTKNCLGCHGGLKKEGGLDLRTMPAMLKGGESGPAIEKGHADRSELWKQIASDSMPSGDDREKLSAADKARVKAWINAGMPTVSAAAVPVKLFASTGFPEQFGPVEGLLADLVVDRLIAADTGLQVFQ